MNELESKNTCMNEWMRNSFPKNRDGEEEDPLSEIWKKTDLCRIISFYNWMIKHVFTILNRHNGRKIVSG